MLKILGSKSYEDVTRNYGDCIVFIEGDTAVIYDCGSEEHAQRVVELLDECNIEKATVILSHNDDDHFKGIPYLIEQDRVKSLFTILLLKYKQELLNEIDDGRRNLDSIGEAIRKMYDNIASLSRKVQLLDVYESGDALPQQLKFVGPTFDYMIEAAAKGLDNREGDTIDRETITNAASVQIELEFSGRKILLTGDCTPAAIPENINLGKYDYIQLPHHGKYIHAEAIFDCVGNNNQVVYVVSDNTGNSNGGSDELVIKSKGHRVKNTKVEGDIPIETTAYSKKTAGYIVPPYTGRTLGI